jgi:hypothetical protein
MGLVKTADRLLTNAEAAARKKPAFAHCED